MGWRVQVKFIKGGYTYIHLDSFADLEWKLGAYSEDNIEKVTIERQEKF
jgi:hypothetical protein